MPPERTPQKKSYASIEAYRSATKTTQQALAKLLGISQSALSMIEAGERIPRGRLALRIHDRTGVPLATLLRRRKDSAA